MSQVPGYTFKDKNLFNLAMIHPSMKKNGSSASYERLEFLGDSVLSLVIADLLYNKFKNVAEGKLALIHSALVKTETLATIALKIGLNTKLKMERSEERNNGRANKNNLEDAMEALIAAIYLDGGFSAVQNFIELHWQEFLSSDLLEMKKDPKSALQEWAQKKGKPIPLYSLVRQVGTDHSPIFDIEVTVEGVPGIVGSGASKKQAQIIAAEKMLEFITNKGGK